MKKILFGLLMILTYQNCLGNPAIYVSDLKDAFHLSESVGLDVLVIFTSDNCVFCNKLKNDIQNDINMISDKIICYVDITKNKDLVKTHNVKSIPDSIVFSRNKEKSRLVGYKNKTSYIDFIKNN
jgi:thioredoxin-related protein